MLGACGGGAQAPRAAQPPSSHDALRLANCSDWNRGSAQWRGSMIVRLRAFFGSDVTSGTRGASHGPGPVLPDKQAYDVLQRYCALPFARAFTLYRLYGRAAGFSTRP
jgi:hypothetical protein